MSSLWDLIYKLACLSGGVYCIMNEHPIWGALMLIVGLGGITINVKED